MTQNKKKNPVRAEVSDGQPRVISLDYLGQRYTIDREAIDDLEIFELIEDGKTITAVRQLLGNKKWVMLKESARNPKTGKVSMDALNNFLNLLMRKVSESGN